MKQDIIKTYIRDENNNPKGVAVAVKTDTGVDYGFALCNRNLDKWDKKLGVSIALARATSPKAYQLPNVPDRLEAVLDAYERLEARALKYFKDVDPELIVINERDIESW